jgi:hypothetical protein
MVRPLKTPRLVLKIYLTPIELSPIYLAPIELSPIYLTPIELSLIYLTPICRASLMNLHVQGMTHLESQHWSKYEKKE